MHSPEQGREDHDIHGVISADQSCTRMDTIPNDADSKKLERRRLMRLVFAIAVAVFGLLTLTRFAVTNSPARPSSDEVNYRRLAENVVAGKGFTLDAKNQGKVQVFPYIHQDGPTLYCPPFPVVYMAAVVRFGLEGKGLAIINTLLIVCATVMLFLALSYVVPLPVAFATAILLLSDKMLYYYAATHPWLLDTVWYALLMSTMYVVIRARAYRQIPGGVALGLLLGVMFLTRGETLFIAPLAMLLGCRHPLRPWRSWRYLSICAVVTFTIMLPWMIRNYSVTGYMVPSRVVMGWVMWTSNNPNTLDADSLAVAYTTGAKPLPVDISEPWNEVEIDKSMSRASMKFMIDHTDRWMSASLRRFLYLVAPFFSLAGIRSHLLDLTLHALALCGLFCIRWRDVRLWPVFYPALVYILLLTFIVVVERHRFRMHMRPAEALLIASAVWFIALHMVSLYKRDLIVRNLRRLVGVVLVAALYVDAAAAAPTIGDDTEPLVAVDFEDGFGASMPASVPKGAGGTRIVSSEDGHVLQLKGDAAPGWWQGIRLEPFADQKYKPNTDYELRFDAKVGASHSLQVYVFVWPSDGDSGEAAAAPQVLAATGSRYMATPSGWQRYRVFFTTPFTDGCRIQVRLTLKKPQKSSLNALIDNVEVRESSIVARYMRQFFTTDKYNRR